MRRVPTVLRLNRISPLARLRVEERDFFADLPEWFRAVAFRLGLIAT